MAAEVREAKRIEARVLVLIGVHLLESMRALDRRGKSRLYQRVIANYKATIHQPRDLEILENNLRQVLKQRALLNVD